MDLDQLAKRLDAKPLHHLPVVAAVVDQLHITEVVDALCPMDPRARVSDADCVKLMILNVLQGRVALYLMNHWLDRTDVEVLLGPGRPTEAFTDARLGATLDHLYAAGTDDVFSGVMVRYLEDWRAETGERDLTVHHDTTTVSLYGQYEGDNFGPTPLLGFSKDHRPDLKQLVFGLSLHGATQMPLFSSVLDGNTADAGANRLHIESLAELLPEDGEVTVVGDCKLVDDFTVRQLETHGWHFVSLVPDSFAIRSELVERVRQQGEELPVLWEGEGRRKGEIRRYRGTSFEAPLWKQYEDSYRFLVVQSDQLAERFEATLEAKLERQRTAADKALRQRARKGFKCEEDARSAVERALKKLDLIEVEVAYEVEEVPVKRARPGRPRKDEPRQVRTVWRPRSVRVTPRAQAIERARFHASHFVLVTDHRDRSAWSDERVLAEYRHQHTVEGHTGFRWLKAGAAVSPTFLKKPHRIAALGMVLILALAVRNYIQYQLRHRLAATGQAVDDRKRRPTQKPTTETAFLGFEGVQILRLWHEDGGSVIQRRAEHLTPHCLTVLAMLGLEPDIFTRPSGVGKPRGPSPPTSRM